MNELSLVIRLGFMEGIDFYEEHKKMLDKHGYVDMCVFTTRRPNMMKYNNTLFIKEAKKAGNRMFKARIKEVCEAGRIYPTYYKKYNMSNQTWLRIDSLEIVEMNDFIQSYSTISGKELQSVFRSSTTLFGVIKK